MELKLFQKGFNYSQDGPGNRLVYHLKGCNMHCPWCSNPEGMTNDCANIFTATVDEIIQESVLSKPMFFENGGVTFTGGECTLQFEALKATLEGLKANNINTAIETNGTYKDLPLLFDSIDYLIMDFKHPSSKCHKEFTGVGNEVIKQNIISASQKSKNLLIRVPLISGFNTAEKDIEAFLKFFGTLNNATTSFEVLKYHEYGKDKWKKLGLDYKMQNAFVDEALRNDFENKIEKIGLKVVRT